MLGKRGYNNLPVPDAKRRRVSDSVLGKRKAEGPVQSQRKRRRIVKDLVPVPPVPQVNITFNGEVPSELHLHFH